MTPLLTQRSYHGLALRYWCKVLFQIKLMHLMTLPLQMIYITHYMLNHLEEKYIYFAFYIIPVYWYGAVNWNPSLRKSKTSILCQYYVCWWPGDVRSQGITRYSSSEISSPCMARFKSYLKCQVQWIIASQAGRLPPLDTKSHSLCPCTF